MPNTIEHLMHLAELLCVTDKLEDSATDLRQVLLSRLQRYQSATQSASTTSGDAALEVIQRETALAAMSVIEEAQAIYLGRTGDSQSADSAIPEGIGARDLRHLRILLSLVFKWGTVPSLSVVEASLPHRTSAKRPTSTGIIDLTSVPTDYQLVSTLAARILRLVYPDGVRGSLSPTFITVALLERHVTDLLRPCLILGWLPKSLETSTTPIQHEFRPPIMRLLTNLPAVESIGALGSILQLPNLPAYVRKTCTSLLNRQLYRTDGIQGVFLAIFGDQDQSVVEAPVEKLEQILRLLQTLPIGTNPTEHYNIIIPRILAFLRTGEVTRPDSHVKAAAYCLSRMLVDEGFPYRQVASTEILPLIHAPLLRTSTMSLQGSGTLEDDNVMHPQDALAMLIKLLTNTDPSPSLISTLISPILPALYSLKEHVSRKLVDPSLQQSLHGLLVTWGRIIDPSDGINTLWKIIEGDDLGWEVDVAGKIRRREHIDEVPGVSMFTPESLQAAEAAGEFDINPNVMNLEPDPAQFAQYLKAIDRVDIASELFVRLLEGYKVLKTSRDSDPLRTLLYLQLIMQMQTKLSSGSSKSDLLSRPDHILSFIKHTLSSKDVQSKSHENDNQSPKHGLTLADLRITREEEMMEQRDSDDEDEDENDESDDELFSTAVDLLLAVLESNPKLPAQSAPILNDIFELLEPLTTGQSESLRALAREARMVITARMASSSSIPSNAARYTSQEGEDPEEIYQKALKLLQDPILPVRAHGLLLLRQLVSTKANKLGSATERLPSVNQALVPAILPIFLQSLQDEDSYIYLNAVQGLSAMVDTHGKDVLKGLLNAYCGDADVEGTVRLNVAQLEVRLRVGEALSQIVRRCGSALEQYANVLVPALFRVIRASYLPATLRSSALSLLAQCANTYSLALLPFADDLVSGAIDLLQTEARTAPMETEEVNLDEQPTSLSSKVAPLRRSAIHLVSLLLRSYIQSTYDSGPTLPLLDEGTLKRLALTLRYLAATDPDGVVKMMAREADALIEGLEKATVGL